MLTGNFLQRFSDRCPVPMEVALAPEADVRVRRLLASEAPAGARFLSFPADRAPVLNGPTILVLSPEDMRGPRRGTLLALAKAALPGRPILFGGAGHREHLLDAINNFRVLHVVAEDANAATLVDALAKSFEVLQIECGLTRTADELELETHNLNRAVVALKETQEKLRHAERLTTLGRVTTSLLPVIAGHLDALQAFNNQISTGIQRDSRMEELLKLSFTGIRALDSMVGEIRGYAESRPESLHLEKEDLDAIVAFAVSFSRHDPLVRKRELVEKLGAKTLIRGDCFRLYQVIINLVRNAFQATTDGGQILVRTWAEGDNAFIDIENNGAPIPPELLDRIFEPFFTTKGENGMGLGLALCRTTLARHGGSIEATSEPGPLTRFRIRLPRAK